MTEEQVDKTEPEPDNQSGETPELVCNCNDPFKTTVCPVCFGQNSKPGYSMDDNAVILTDEDLVAIDPVIWSGHEFFCKKCRRQVLHHLEHCPGCRSKLIIQSTVVTTHIKKLETEMQIQRLKQAKG